MRKSDATLERQGLRLLQLGILLIFYSSFAGFAIPMLGSPRIGLSVHTLSALQGVFFLAVGSIWPRFALGHKTSLITFWCFIHGSFAILAAYTVAAITGVGIETISLAGELPHGLAHGGPGQETLIKVLAYSSAPTGLLSFGMILWGLRVGPMAAD